MTTPRTNAVKAANYKIKQPKLFFLKILRVNGTSAAAAAINTNTIHN